MKKCPKCQRTFEDMFSFCLEDGTVLSASFDPNPPPTMPFTHAAPPTEVLTKNNKKTSLRKFIIIGLAGVFLIPLLIAGIFFASRSKNGTVRNGAASNSNLAVKTTPSASASPSASATPTPANNSNNPANANLAANSASPTPSPTKTPETETPDGVVKKLKQGMSYAAARKMLMASGWQAVTQSPNRELFGQEEYIVNELKFYEMETCSGTGMGYCRFLFRDVNKRKLVVVTVNNEEGSKGGPKVENWSFEK